MYRVMFLGDRLIAANSLKQLISSKYSSKFDLKVIVSSPNFLENAKKYLNINPALTISNEARNMNLIQQAIIDYGIDLLISVQHNWILSKEILSEVRLAFNLHNAKLPDYKGYNSISHAIHNRDKEFYSTMHWMAEKVDMGDIAYEESVQIDANEDASSLYIKTIDSSRVVFDRLLSDLYNDLVPPNKSISGNGKFYKKDFLSTLKNLSDIHDDIELDYRVRSAFFPPHEPAYIIKNNNKMHLLPDRWKNVCWEQIEPGYNINWLKI